MLLWFVSMLQVIHLIGGEKPMLQCEGIDIARFVRLSLYSIMGRDVLLLFSWSGTTRVNKQGNLTPKESFQSLKGICGVLQGKYRDIPSISASLSLLHL